MAWNAKDVMSQRMEFVVRAKASKQSFGDLCREFGISRPTGYLWLRRYEALGSLTELAELSRRPKNSPHKLCPSIEERITKLRQETGWGARKLQRLLKCEQGILVAVRTINRVLDRNNLIPEKNRIQLARKRFEREQPNQLWQMDFKGEFKVGSKLCFPLTVLDDHSRYSIAIVALTGTETSAVEKSLIKTFETYGLPEQILTDHGSPWWATRSEHGLTRLSVKLIKQGISLCFSGVGHPQTQGKIERFHRTLKQEINHQGIPQDFQSCQSLFDRIRKTYNHRRPHEALGMETPATKYSPSPKAYTPNPKPWVYPHGSQVTTVDSSGSIRWKSKQLFVSHSLAGEQVKTDLLDSSLIVTYRHMKVREINFQTGEGRPFPKTQV